MHDAWCLSMSSSVDEVVAFLSDLNSVSGPFFVLIFIPKIILQLEETSEYGGMVRCFHGREIPLESLKQY